MTEPSFNFNEEDILIEPQAKPIIEDKYERKTYQFVYHQKEKKRVFRGVKEVRKAIRRDQKGLVILAADTHPFDVISSFPVNCENKGLSYYFVKSKSMLSKASGTKQTASVVMIREPEDKEDKKSYQKLLEKAQEMAAKTQTFIM
ncbi:Ribosomal_protein L7Ae/L30e/S12e/Gadd45 family protein [Hexamita inflata]|nr:Ribosomal protein L7Ae/L30e/S12e/Gadd45 family protein [Hexamita inflata]